jgi:hypothetical protein
VQRQLTNPNQTNLNHKLIGDGQHWELESHVGQSNNGA